MDDEVKGEGNSYDFGARMLDSRLGRWFAIDKEAYRSPDLSVYCFVNNDPIRFIDPNGKFLIDVHKRIMRNAFKKGKYKLQTEIINNGGFIYERLTKNANEIAEYRDALAGTYTTASGTFTKGEYDGSVVSPDVKSLPKHIGGGGLPSNDKEHFDNMNFDEIVSNFNSVYSKMLSAADSYKAGEINAEALGNKVGPYFHALQDLYSHSNYIELYKSLYGETSTDKIPVFGDVMSDNKWTDFRNLLKKELHTGEYPGSGSGSHKAMNHDLGRGSKYSFLKEVKDKIVNWNSRAAEDVATKSSKFMNDKIEQIILEKK